MPEPGVTVPSFQTPAFTCPPAPLHSFLVGTEGINPSRDFQADGETPLSCPGPLGHGKDSLSQDSEVSQGPARPSPAFLSHLFFPPPAEGPPELTKPVPPWGLCMCCSTMGVLCPGRVLLSF